MRCSLLGSWPCAASNVPPVSHGISTEFTIQQTCVIVHPISGKIDSMTQKELDTHRLISKYGIVSDQVDAGELAVVLQELARALEVVDGSVAEFGCYVGTTSLYIRRVLDGLGSEAEFHVYDSFEGLPEKKSEDTSPLGEHFKAGELAVGKKAFIREFQKAGLKLPVIHKGWFDQLAPTDVPEQIAFAYLDGDYYQSIRIPLELITSMLAPGATIVVDDYGNQALPGARKAVDEWCREHQVYVNEVRSLAVIRI